MAEGDVSAPPNREANPERSVVVSPLLNLAPARPTGPTLNHRRPIVQLRGSRISGTAMLALAPDHKIIDVRVRLDRPRPIDIRLRRIARHTAWNEERAKHGDLLVVEIVARESSTGGLCDARRFALDDRRACRMFADAEDLQGTGVRSSELRAESVAGVRLEPARESEARGQKPRPYFTERMLAEIAAAEFSATALVASRHVELAILYARELRGARAVLR